MEEYTMFSYLRWKLILNWSIDSTQSQSKSQEDYFFGRHSQADSKIYMEMQRYPKQFWKNKVGELTSPHFKTCSKATVFKIIWFWPRDQEIDQ